jgi:Tachylectin
MLKQLLYDIQADGKLMWFQHIGSQDGTFSWAGPNEVGTGWGEFIHVFSGGHGIVYAIASGGDLMWFRHVGRKDGSFKWEGPKKVGTGWGEFTKVFSGGQGVIYAITPTVPATLPIGIGPGMGGHPASGGDLMWYRHTGRDDGSFAWEGPHKVGIGWGSLKHVFAASDDNVIYGITPVVPASLPTGIGPGMGGHSASGGDLMWYRHLGQQDGSFKWMGPNRVGTGWELEHAFAGADGIIYGVKPIVPATLPTGIGPGMRGRPASGGELLWFHHIGQQDGTFTWNGPKKVGTGWGGLKQVFTGDDGLSLAEATDEIQRKYAEIGERLSPLGRPLDAASPVQSSGTAFFRDYRGGQIKVQSEGGASAFATHRIVVRFRGIHCFGKSEAVDEPYAIVAVYAPDARDSTVTTKFPTGRDSYTDFVASTDASESTNVSPSSPGWAPQSVAISCTVMEHDSGDPDRAAAAVEDAIKKAASDAGAADDISVYTGILDDLKIPGLIADVLGVGDDVIGSQVLQIDVGELKPKPPMKQFQSISYNFESPLLSDGNASYKLYFEVFVEEIPPSTVL